MTRAANQQQMLTLVIATFLCTTLWGTSALAISKMHSQYGTYILSFTIVHESIYLPFKNVWKVSPPPPLILSHPKTFFWEAMSNYSTVHSVFKIKSLDEQSEKHQAYKPSCRYVQALMVIAWCICHKPVVMG